MSSAQSLVGFSRELSAANANGELSSVQLTRLDAELQTQEPVIGAAVLVATAFRLRDESALIAALRLLVQAVGRLEEQDSAADA